jgi:co-chaperonin GroES (HSP10)
MSSSITAPKIRLLANRILVLPDPIKEKNERGIIIPESVKSPLTEGTVILVSEAVSPLLHEWERVLFPTTAGVEREFDGIKYRFLSGPTLTDQGDIWAVV